MARDKGAIIAGLSVLIFAFAKEASAAGGICARLSSSEIWALCNKITSQYFPGVDPNMLAAMVEIESSRYPCAYRAEPHINDASVGLMQTLEGTALWLWESMGARAYGKPDLAKLRDAETSIYFGAAMVNWLRNYAGVSRSEQWIVRAYNGGPGGANSAQTKRHYEKYLDAKGA